MNMVDVTVKKMKANLANLITLGNISFGGAAVMATINESYSNAVLFILIAALLDRYDGKVARKYNLESELGKQLDSMSDIISFGVAPAILMYEVTLTDFGSLGMIVAVFYIACGAFRLARFNVTESDGYFTGLPITAAGAILTVSYFFSGWLSPTFFLILFPVLAILMVSNFTLKKV
ncbi:CDP-diacylglycerol--serine O-phosphatidyltransferase [Kurthia zopfii]|uniref:CDP-diacylglycerol--serine O-phosphatidyltransferase n=2 Tax=Kurthia zopfii TaxID=1650 RepID=A0A8B4QBN0_9BACL|nr:CDP-diacylglycerol--serine O-phosphatidyltransferase [Kurthia zopfii]GEK29742.1 CDP-diacylglycerol--serine O-phosphatidyltransferase [Kurthia zopfii]STX10092.1 CDP-diacylglycerol-serine O-phosphatidyltransferase [Kurthia zopfii]